MTEQYDYERIKRMTHDEVAAALSAGQLDELLSGVDPATAEDEAARFAIDEISLLDDEDLAALVAGDALDTYLARRRKR